MGFSTLAALESHLGGGTWWLAYRSQESRWALASLAYPQVQPGQRTTGEQLEPSVKEGVGACEETGLYRIGERKWRQPVC